MWPSSSCVSSSSASGLGGPTAATGADDERGDGLELRGKRLDAGSNWQQLAARK